MITDGNTALENMAKEAGFESVDEFVHHCEIEATLKRVNRSLDRALLPDDLLKGMTERELMDSFDIPLKTVEETPIKQKKKDRKNAQKNR